MRAVAVSNFSRNRLSSTACALAGSSEERDGGATGRLVCSTPGFGWRPGPLSAAGRGAVVSRCTALPSALWLSAITAAPPPPSTTTAPTTIGTRERLRAGAVAAGPEAVRGDGLGPAG